MEEITIACKIFVGRTEKKEKLGRQRRKKV
jgi:hypothetical protein